MWDIVRKAASTYVSQIIYINSLGACVRPSDATVPRFNPPAEPARTVRTDGQTDFLRENRPGQTASV